jgi:hypothetical protein
MRLPSLQTIPNRVPRELIHMAARRTQAPAPVETKLACRGRGFSHPGQLRVDMLSRPPFFIPAEVEAAMMRGNAEVGPHRGWGGILKFFAASRGTAEAPSLCRNYA